MLEFEPPIEGCTDEEIEDIQRSQGVSQLPALYIEFMRKLGRKTGGLEWACDLQLTYPKVCRFKHSPFDIVQNSEIFIFALYRELDTALYFNVNENDPIVNYVTFNQDKYPFMLEPITEQWDNFSHWLIDFMLPESKD